MDVYGDAAIVYFDDDLDKVVDFSLTCTVCGKVVEDDLVFDEDFDGKFAYFDCCGNRIMMELDKFTSYLNFYQMEGF
jgi:hypothetical protein